jgi:pyruvate/2-oxoglutarate dehydrogenase complex dihydrolipoamide dehydrogenase (E3) component
VIDAGSAGVAAAQAGRALGKRVVLVAAPGPLGGTCILRGCMPAKTLLSSAERLGDVRSAATVGVRERAPATIDLHAVIARKRELVEYFAEDRVEEIESFPLVRGNARFVARDRIVAGDRTIAAERFVVATGSTIDAATVPCLSPGDYFTSEDALEMTQAPDRLVVIGGGPVGCEFAQYFARAGSNVTLVQDAPELLVKEDCDIGAAVRATLEAEGIRVVCDATVIGCSRHRERRKLVVRTPRGDESLEADGVMLASGRVPNTHSLDLSVASVRLSEGGGIAVDAMLATSNLQVYAAGDVLGRRCLVHAAVYAGALAAKNAFAPEPLAIDFARIESHAVYTQPQVAIAGLTEWQARASGKRIRVRRHPFHEVGKAVVADEVAGFAKMIADESGTILGAALFGDDAVELIAEAIVAIHRGMTVGELAAMPHLHPTMGEIFPRVAEAFATSASN